MGTVRKYFSGEKKASIGKREEEDFLREHRNSESPHWHGSYREHLPRLDVIWERVVKILKDDETFGGTLEGELNLSDWKVQCTTGRKRDSEHINLSRPFDLETCLPGEHKACDIHLKVHPGLTSVGSVEKLERLGFIYFKKDVPNLDDDPQYVGVNTYDIFSLTFEDVEIGKRVFAVLREELAINHGVYGWLKFEVAERYWVHPADAKQLPIVRTAFAKAWLAST